MSWSFFLLKVWITLAEAKAQGFSDVLFLDAATGKNVEELFASNVFIVKVIREKKYIHINVIKMLKNKKNIIRSV